MKYIIYSLLLCMCCVQSLAQSNYQVSLLDDFLKNKGATLIQSWAHPTCTATEYSYHYYNHTYYVKIYYRTSSDRTFSCSYTLDFSTSGELLSLSYDCDEFLGRCFNACNFLRNMASTLMSDENNREAIKRVGKTLSNFTCSDACYVRLYSEWMVLGYYAKY